MVDTFDTHVLNRVVQERVDDTQFLVNTFFPEIAISTDETIMFDKTAQRQLITPFVSPLREGRLIAEQGYETDSFRPAYLKDKRVFDPNKAFRRRPGERIGGTLTPAQRLNAQVAFAIDEQIKMLNRRFEVMAADVLTTGKATIVGEGYPSKVVDFGRDSDNTKVLLTSDRWGESGVSPVQDLEDWAQEVVELSGESVTEIVMTIDAWKLLKADDALDDLLDNTRRDRAPASLAMGPTTQPRSGIIYRGSLGQFNIWTYSGSYTDPEDNTSKTILPDYTVLLGGRGMDGVKHFGAIRDLRAGISAQQYFVKSWEEEDPSRRFLLMQSAPLLVPYRPNAVMSVTVR